MDFIDFMDGLIDCVLGEEVRGRGEKRAALHFPVIDFCARGLM